MRLAFHKEEKQYEQYVLTRYKIEWHSGTRFAGANWFLYEDIVIF